MKTIANRIKDVISNLLHNPQTGFAPLLTFIKGRYIGDNIGLPFEIIDNAEDEKKMEPCLIFFSDFEKAFESINHTFTISCLKHFNFGEDFNRWVKKYTMTPKAVSQIMVGSAVAQW